MQQQHLSNTPASLHQTFARKRRAGWITLWCFGLLFCIAWLVNGISGLRVWPSDAHDQILTIAYVIAWPYWTARLVPLLLWEFFGTETIESTPHGLTLTRRIGPWKRQWHFFWDQLPSLELAAPLPKGKHADLPKTLERGTLGLRVGGREVRFGIRLERNAALSLLEEVQTLVRHQERLSQR
jgi:hypothetical protein